MQIPLAGEPAETPIKRRPSGQVALRAPPSQSLPCSANYDKAVSYEAGEICVGVNSRSSLGPKS